MKDRGINFADWLWTWVEGKPILHHWKSLSEVPPATPLSEAISRELKRQGFTFVGPTIIYAYLQSAGLVNDHLIDCFRYKELISGA
jgi:DNA-3-methyladenine glycosylase I